MFDTRRLEHDLRPGVRAGSVSVKDIAVVIGATGGIGAALADALEEEGAFANVHRFGRHGDLHSLDLTEEATIAAAAASLPDDQKLSLVIVATGMLHDRDRRPEKTMAALDAQWMVDNYRLNCVGPALVAKHFLPRMPRDSRAVFAVLGARVGSIADNRAGGWYSYRASKAALVMTVRNLAIEHARTHKRGIVVALHPGTVDTRLSEPFQGNVAPGSLFTPDRAAMQLLDVIDGLNVGQSGKHIAWDGTEISG
nr:SDR family NAD(P)-dependent oxidoreductase [Sphingobium subterraneum]